MADISILPMLKMIPLFTGLNEEDHKDIIKNIEVMYYPAKYTIFSEGDTADAMYIIKNGAIRVFHKGGENDVAHLKPFSFFGEMALFKDEPRNASVETVTETEVLILKKEDFYKLVAENHNISKVLSEGFFLRQRVNQERENSK